MPSPTLPLSHSYLLLSASLLKNDFDSNVGYGPEAYERIGYIDQPSTSHTAFSRGNGLMHLSISSIIPCEQIWRPPIRASGALSFLLRRKLQDTGLRAGSGQGACSGSPACPQMRFRPSPRSPQDSNYRNLRTRQCLTVRMFLTSASS